MKVNNGVKANSTAYTNQAGHAVNSGVSKEVSRIWLAAEQRVHRHAVRVMRKANQGAVKKCSLAQRVGTVKLCG